MKTRCLKIITFVTSVVVLALNPAHGEVFDLSAIINTSQELPAPAGVPAGAGGFASVKYDDVSKELSWDIAWQNLSDVATGMHFHAAAAPGANAGVVVNVGSISGLSSPSVGSTIVTDAFAADLLAGLSYLNIHTMQNGPGEIRGQVGGQNINMAATMNVAQEVPVPIDVPLGAGGAAKIALDPTTNTLGWMIEWSDLSGPATGMHFHGPAAAGETAGVKLNVGDISGLTSPSIGSAVVTDEFKSQILAGQWYLNIHTATNGPGEIRGQMIPEPATGGMALVGLWGIGMLGRRRRISNC